MNRVLSLQRSKPQASISSRLRGYFGGLKIAHRAHNKRVQKVFDNNKKENIEKSSFSHKIWVIESLLLVFTTLLLFQTWRTFSLAEFSINHSYTILLNSVENSDTQRGTQLISFRGKPHEIYVVSLPTEYNREMHVGSSNDALARTTGISIDGSIVSETHTTVDTKWQLLRLLFKALSHDTTQTTLLNGDMWKMIIYVLTMHSSHFKVITPTLPESCEQCLFEHAVQTIIPRYLSDTRITAPTLTIGVVNQTGVNGLAKRVSDIFSGYGFSVVHISSDTGVDSTSQIILTKDTEQTRYAAQKVQGFFAAPAPVVVDESSFTLYRSDVIVIIGADSGNWEK